MSQALLETMADTLVSASDVSLALDYCAIAGATFGLLPFERHWRIFGPVVTARLLPTGSDTTRSHDDYLPLLCDGAVLALDAGALQPPLSVWGDLRSAAALAQGAAGAVIDGAISDLPGTVAVGFPVFARGTSLITSKHRAFIERSQGPVVMAGVLVEPGDIAFGDATGVVFVPKDRADDVDRHLRAIRDGEASIRSALAQGVPLKEARSRHAYNGPA